MAQYPLGAHGCTGCELCSDVLADAERAADEAFWADEDRRFNEQQERERAEDEAFWAAS